MEPNNPYGQPPIVNQGAVWPPPPTSQATSPQALTFPFKTLLSYVQGSVPDFRVGTVTLYPEGITIQGKAVLRSEIQVPILAVCLLLRLGFFIAYAIIEYAIRRDDMLSVPWSNVQQIVTVPKKQRVCIVYSAPNYKGVVKTFSLAFKLEPAYYGAFVQAAQPFVRERVVEGKLRTWTSPRTWVFCGGLALSLLIILVVFLTTGQTLGK